LAQQEVVVDAPPGVVYALSEGRSEAGVGDAAADSEAILEFGHVAPERLKQPGERRHIASCIAGQQEGVLSRQHVGLGLDVIRDKATGGHSTQPLAHVALLEVGTGRQLVTCRRTLREHVEQPKVVTQGDQPCEDAAGVKLEELASEDFHPVLIELC
jgi:hypothetical protein